MKSPFSLHSSPGAHHRRSGENVLVDLLFQDIAFAATDFTNDLKEIRLSVRLSKDVTTEEPAAAPFSPLCIKFRWSRITFASPF
ncbi:hypothetical protein AGDE_15206 [Angomonas deanei]|uniref:Uncharacterized protein n=1 Tax=Angomonas deanei TaxID=59799 RepID=A0A7G2CCI3_9TRYP|nr:hypothetical protein AGDE_15206 [Angomonas deanei]CAD2215792.1 hypothetical protein, conserved [Angomonas deanei]|eukprot:EPY19527.1 hypothetical protein AGDE_15206 [Angomonas deanei]